MTVVVVDVEGVESQLCRTLERRDRALVAELDVMAISLIMTGLSIWHWRRELAARLARYRTAYAAVATDKVVLETQLEAKEVIENAPPTD